MSATDNDGDLERYQDDPEWMLMVLAGFERRLLTEELTPEQQQARVEALERARAQARKTVDGKKQQERR